MNKNAVLSEFPGVSYVATAHLTRLTNVISKASRGKFGKSMAIRIREAAGTSVGSSLPAKSMELRHTISSIKMLGNEISEIESEINKLMSELNSPITTIPGIGSQNGCCHSCGGRGFHQL